MKHLAIAIEDIKTDGDTQPRAAMSQETIDEYAQALEDGASFPPLTVFHDQGKYWLADGFHRLAAFKLAGRSMVSCDAQEGNRRDAVLFSFGVNSDHGLRRTNKDKRKSVERMLKDEEWSKWSDREIARQCKVSHPMVGDVRTGLSGNSSTCEAETRTARRGDQVYEHNVAPKPAEKSPQEAIQSETQPKAPKPPQTISGAAVASRGATLQGPTELQLAWGRASADERKEFLIWANVTVPNPQSEASQVKAILGECLNGDDVKALVSHRRAIKKPLTPRAASILAGKLGQAPDPSAAVNTMIERGWAGFEVDWMRNTGQRIAQNGTGETHRDMIERVAARREAERNAARH